VVKKKFNFLFFVREKTEKQRNNLPMLYRFARLLFELHDHPKTGESLLPEVRYSLESYINLVTKNMGELEREYENCAEEEKADHEYLKFKKANLKYHEQAQWGVICCKLLQVRGFVFAMKLRKTESRLGLEFVCFFIEISHFCFTHFERNINVFKLVRNFTISFFGLPFLSQTLSTSLPFSL
jgi:hypothetical protein